MSCSKHLLTFAAVPWPSVDVGQARFQAMDLEERAPKRLRVWKLQQELESPTPCQKESNPCQKEGSALCSRLLELWSQGHLSARMVCELALLATLDGCNSEELHSLARCGNYGQLLGNCSRDLMQLYCRQERLPKPFLVAERL